MSASLVGSEMCIRDRPGGDGRRPGSSGDRSCRGCFGHGPGGRPLNPAPVSYTHLTLPTICSV
eukprot:9566669-Alexandrium_andersonii.AAC.1